VNNNVPAILRTLITYAVCVPLAVFVGYILTDPLDLSTFGLISILLLALVLPLLLRWHHWLLLLSWNLSFDLFYLKGQPPPWLVMTAVSLVIVILQGALSQQRRFIYVPQIILPLIAITAVMVLTAKLTGGFGLRAFGSEVYGGRKYVYALGAVLGYFALTSTRIPPNRIKLALALFFLGGVTAAIGDLYGVLPSFFNPIFWFFSPDPYAAAEMASGSTGVIRFAGIATASLAVLSYMQARYGIRGLFLSGKPWRWMIFIALFGTGMLGGFRIYVIEVAVAFLVQFFLEGMHRTRLLPIFGAMGIAAMAVVLPFADKMPLAMQRAVAFLPVKINSEAKAEAQESLNWRFEMWSGLLPEIPRHLLLGTGYGFAAGEYQFMGNTAFQSSDPSQQGLALSMDYHNGWLSVLLTFGIWGMLATLWFFGAGLWALTCNFRYGDPKLRAANAFLLAAFLVRCLMFLTVSGMGWHSDLPAMVGWLGLGICLNSGVVRKAVKTAAQPARPLPAGSFLRRPPQPVFQRKFN
jgi:O-Antigen ligase